MPLSLERYEVQALNTSRVRIMVFSLTQEFKSRDCEFVCHVVVGVLVAPLVGPVAAPTSSRSRATAARWIMHHGHLLKKASAP